MNEKAPQRKSKRNNNHTATYLLCALTISIVIVIVLLTSVLSKKSGKENETPEHTVDTASTDTSTDTFTEEAAYPTISEITLFGRNYAQDITEFSLSSDELTGLEHDEIYSDICKALKFFNSLKSVDLTAAGLELDEMTALKDIYPDIDFIWTVKLCGKEVSSDETELDISGIEITDIEDFKKHIKALDNLNYIDMCDCGLTNEQMEQLKNDFPSIKFVWKVTLGLWTIRTDTVAFSTLKDGTITYRLTNEDCKVLKYCTDMVALDLGHNKVTDLSFLEYMPELKILILVDNWLTDTQSPYLYDLSMLKYCPKLMYLEFFVGDVSDISVFDYLPNLVDLNISYNPISDVSHLLNFTKLERLYIEHTSLTEQDYELLKETYPDAYIVYYGEGSVDQGWREHERYFAMIDMFHNNYVNDLFKN